jgi:hypothetical protein
MENEQPISTQQKGHSVNRTIIWDTSQKPTENTTKYLIPDKTTLAGEKLKSSAKAQVWSRIFAAITIIILMYNSGIILTNLMSGMHNSNDLVGSYVLSFFFGLFSFFCWIESVVTLYQAGKILKDSH